MGQFFFCETTQCQNNLTVAILLEFQNKKKLDHADDQIKVKSKLQVIALKLGRKESRTTTLCGIFEVTDQ